MMLPIFAALFSLVLASPTPEGRATSATCAPPAANGVTFGTILPDLTGLPGGPSEIGVFRNTVQGFFDTAEWLPAGTAGTWNFVKTNDSSFLIQHKDFPNMTLTGIASSGGIEMRTDAQVPFNWNKWNITCSTCPESGLANDCVFQFGQAINPNCILANRLNGELGNWTLALGCESYRKTGLSLTINYHQ